MKTHPSKVSTKCIKSVKIVRIEFKIRSVEFLVTDTLEIHLRWNQHQGPEDEGHQKPCEPRFNKNTTPMANTRSQSMVKSRFGFSDFILFSSILWWERLPAAIISMRKNIRGWPRQTGCKQKPLPQKIILMQFDKLFPLAVPSNLWEGFRVL